MPEAEDAAENGGKGGKAWLRRLLPRLVKRKESGDVIAASVGEGGRGVAVGKNIIQIGTVVIPTLPVLALVILAVAALAIWVLRPRGPKEMTGEFNIAVAQFGQIDKDGEVRLSKDGERLSQWLFERLQDEYESLSPELSAQVWHDSLDLGVRIGTIPGMTSEARAKAAPDFAKKINADIVIYGNLAVEENPASFIPEFYVTELPEAEEIVGHHELGAPIPIQLPIDRLRTRLQFNQKLTSRAKALTLFTVGLAWEFAGNPERALEFFRQAEQVEDWADNEGKEILYLFIGREARFLERYEESFAAFEKALAINPDYVRAHIGLGNVHYEKAQRLPPTERLETADLDEAIAEYQQALEAVPHSPGAQAELKAHLALGGAYRLKGEAYLHSEEYDTATPLLDMAVEETEEALTLIDEGDHRHLALAYLGLGTAYHLKAHILFVQDNEEESEALFETALGAYAQCIEHTDAQPYDWFLKNLKVDYCIAYEEIVQEVLLTLQKGGSQ